MPLKITPYTRGEAISLYCFLSFSCLHSLSGDGQMSVITLPPNDDAVREV